jgi:hypothetical protein
VVYQLARLEGEAAAVSRETAEVEEMRGKKESLAHELSLQLAALDKEEVK